MRKHLLKEIQIWFQEISQIRSKIFMFFRGWDSATQIMMKQLAKGKSGSFINWFSHWDESTFHDLSNLFWWLSWSHKCCIGMALIVDELLSNAWSSFDCQKPYNRTDYMAFSHLRALTLCEFSNFALWLLCNHILDRNTSHQSELYLCGPSGGIFWDNLCCKCHTYISPYFADGVQFCNVVTD